MPTIYCIGGVSGSGKTYLRERNEALRRLPCIDIADIYAQNPGIGREEARIKMLDQLECHLQFHGSSVCMEAFFAPGKLQRKGVEDLAYRYDVTVRYIWCAASREECLRRVEGDVQRDAYYSDDYDDYWEDDERYQARISFINEAPNRYFYERESEEEPYLLADRCQECQEYPYEPPPCSVCGGDIDPPVCIDCAENLGLQYICSSNRCRRTASGGRRRRGYRPY